MIEMCLTVC